MTLAFRNCKVYYGDKKIRIGGRGVGKIKKSQSFVLIKFSLFITFGFMGSPFEKSKKKCPTEIFEEKNSENSDFKRTVLFRLSTAIILLTDR